MTVKKQTATEWLFAHLLPFLEFSDPKEREYFRKCLAESKAMEKEQILEAYVAGAPFGSERALLCEEYYNETYGGDK